MPHDASTDGPPLTTATGAVVRADHRADIQGLRGVAVALVVAFHCGAGRLLERFGLSLFGGGYVGVDVFLVISGFLVTRQLLGVSGGSSLGSFYARRIWRLVPLAGLVALATLIASIALLPSLEWSTTALDGVAAATFWSNGRFALAATDYMAASARESPFLHFWSLSLEEQFYLLWPLTLWWSGRRALPVSIAVLAASFALSLLPAVVTSPWGYFGLHTRAWEFLVGAVIAMRAAELGAMAATHGRWWRGAGLLLIGGAALFYDRDTPFPGVAAVAPTLGAAMVVAAGLGHGGGPAWRLLTSWPLTRCGDLSYGWYLWHWPLLALLWPALSSSPTGVDRLIAAALALALARVTLGLVERRLQRYGRAAPGTHAVALLAGVVVAVAGLGAWMHQAAAVTGWRGPDSPAGARLDVVRGVEACSADPARVRAEPCIRGDVDGRGTVALVGDSHAVHLYPALDAWARQQRLRLLVATKSGCPFAAPDVTLQRFRRPYTECTAWRHDVIRLIERVQPQAVIVARYQGYVGEIVDEGVRVDAARELAVWRAGVAAVLDAIDAVPRVVLLRDIPSPGFDVPLCLAEGHACTLDASGGADDRLWKSDVEVAARFTNVAVLDPSTAICPERPCAPRTADGVIKYRDTHHLTATFAQRLLPFFVAATPVLIGEPPTP